jgi:hypothetical protein
MGGIQNKSGHGIDWIGRALTGKYADQFVAFEVKGSLNGKAANLSSSEKTAPQTSGPNAFVVARLGLASNPDKYPIWAGNNVAAGTKEVADYILKDMQGKTFSGFLIQHDRMGAGFQRQNPGAGVDVHWSLWSNPGQKIPTQTKK